MSNEKAVTAEIIPAPKKVGAPCKLTPQVSAAICAATRAGAFAWIAAATAGVTQATYFRWMSRGKTEWEDYERLRLAHEELPGEVSVPEPSLFASFWHDVYMARAQARMAAETAVRKDNPLAWLRYGPGRDRPGEPGWTETIKSELTGAGGLPLGGGGTQQLDLSRLTTEQLDEYDRLTSLCLAAASGHPSTDQSGEG